MSRLLLVAARLFVGGLFLVAAVTKIPDLAAFAVDVANYRLLPPAVVPYAAPALVGVEIAVGTALLLGLWTRASAALAAALLASFMLGMAQALLRGIDLSCGCFGSGTRASWSTLVRDAGFLLPALAVALRGGGGQRRIS